MNSPAADSVAGDGLRVQHHGSLRSFVAAADDVYRHDPVRFSTELGILDDLASSPRPCLWLSVHKDDRQVVGAALRPLAHPLLTSGLTADSIEAVCRYLTSHGQSLPGVLGNQPAAAEFAARWCAATGSGIDLHREETVYRLTTFRPPHPTSGFIRNAERDDTELLVEWLTQFHSEVFGTPADAATSSALAAQLWTSQSRFLLWCHAGGLPLGMARLHRPVESVSRIGPIFTAHHARGQGVGSAVTAAAVIRAQQTGCTDVLLQTDSKNATTNSLYRRLGFQPIATSLHLRFGNRRGRPPRATHDD